MLLFQYMYNIIYKYNVRYRYFIIQITHTCMQAEIYIIQYTISIHMPYQYKQCMNSFKACNVDYTINLTTFSNSDLSFRVG